MKKVAKFLPKSLDIPVVISTFTVDKKYLTLSLLCL